MAELEKKVAKNSLELTIFRLEFNIYRAKNAWNVWNLRETTEHLQTFENIFNATIWPDEVKTTVQDVKEAVRALKKYVEEKDGTYGYASYRELEHLFNGLKETINQY